jgi:phosphohistidine phosphatase
MELILWRHAEAEPGEPDEGRALTAKGHKQAWKMAEWLDQTLPNTCKILVSPTRRTVQTADATAESILGIVNWPEGREPVLIVGHQPTLGRVAALILTGTVQDWTIRKSAALWIGQKDRGDVSTTYLKAVMAPDLVVK